MALSCNIPFNLPTHTINPSELSPSERYDFAKMVQSIFWILLGKSRKCMPRVNEVCLRLYTSTRIVLTNIKTIYEFKKYATFKTNDTLALT